MTKRLCIIPARAGSKRIPGKNIRDFCGKPMLAHVIEAAKSSKLFDTILISTDSPDVAKVAEQQGCKPDFLRPAALADDHTPLLPVVRHALEEYASQDNNFDTVTLLYATSPMIDPADLKKACATFEKTPDAGPLLSVAPFPCPVEWAFRLDENSKLIPAQPGGLAIRSQDLKPAYFDAAMFCFYTPAYVLASSGAGSDLAFRGFVVPAERVCDIDRPEDWQKAEALFRALSA